MARVLGVLRLSRDRNESTSITRQRGYIESWAAQHGHVIVGWAEDVDVSGSVAPWDRPNLSLWLPDPTSGRPEAERQHEWDVLAAWRLDRVTRRIVHLWQVIEWAQDNGKVIASTSEGFDLSTHMGRVFVGILGALAEGELEAIRERARSSTAHLLRSGRWRGGFIPYGYRQVQNNEGKGWRLVPDEGDTADIMREVVRRIIDGQTVNSVVVWLNQQGTPTPLDAQRRRKGEETSRAEWRVGNLTKMLRAKALLGLVEVTEQVKGRSGKTESVTRTVKGEDGLPLERAQPLISREDYDRLQAVLDKRSNPRAAERDRCNGSMLLQVAFCECGEPLYRAVSRNKQYYRCGLRSRAGRSCGNKSIQAERLEAEVEDSFLTFVGGLPIVKRTFVPGIDNRAELADIEQATADLADDRSRGLYASESGRRVYETQLNKLFAREEILRRQPVTESGWVEEETGVTYRERWESLSSPAERNKELRASGLTFVLHREPVPVPSMFPHLNPEPFIGTSRCVVVVPSDINARVIAHAASSAISAAAPSEAA